MLTKFSQKLTKLITKSSNEIAKKIVFPLSSLEELFPNLEKSYPINPENFATPELNKEIKFDINWESASVELDLENYSLPPIYTATLSQVIYYPLHNLIFTESGKVLEETCRPKLKKNPAQIAYLMLNIKISNLFHIHKFEKITGICSIIRQFTDNHTFHYHTLVDIMPRLYLLNQPEYKDIDEIKLLFSSEPTPVEHFFIDKLAPKNIKITVVQNPDRLYSLDQFIYPTCLTRRGAAYLPLAYLDYFRDRVLPKRESKKINRIFISRANTRWRRMINEDELFEALKAHGFNKYYPEHMSIEEQIELFYDADYVVGIYGSAQTNIIFSHQIKVLEIFTTEYFLPNFYYLAKSLGHTYGYYHGYCPGAGGKKKHISKNDINSIYRADFRVNVSEVIECLLELEKQHRQTH